MKKKDDLDLTIAADAVFVLVSLCEEKTRRKAKKKKINENIILTTK